MSRYSDFTSTAEPWLQAVIQRCSKWTNIRWASYDLGGSGKDERTPVANLQSAQVIGSRQPNGLHRHTVMIDIDRPVAAALVPSSHDGNQHLYIEVPGGVPWDSYQKLLIALEECGIIQSRYLQWSQKRGETFLRPPWIRKGHEKEDQEEALDEWLDTSPPETIDLF